MEKVNLTAPQWQLAAWSEYAPVGGGNGGLPRGILAVRLEYKLNSAVFPLDELVTKFNGMRNDHGAHLRQMTHRPLYTGAVKRTSGRLLGTRCRSTSAVVGSVRELADSSLTVFAMTFFWFSNNQELYNVPG